VAEPSPYQAEYECLKKCLSNTVSNPVRTKGRVYRDSRGRERNEDDLEVDSGIITFAEVYNWPERTLYTLNVTERVVLSVESLTEVRLLVKTWALKDGVAVAVPNSPPTGIGEIGSKEINGLICDGYILNFASNVNAEVWYSRALNIQIHLRILAPDQEIIHQLFAISQTEPEKALFEIPSDYRHR
jgi:hypothetical protein